MWTKSARQKARVVDLEQLGASEAIGRYGMAAFRGLTIGLILGVVFVAFYRYGFLTGVFTAAVLLGARAVLFRKR